MSVHKKLQEARVDLSRAPLKKSGKNEFAGFEYFELGDFLPTTHTVFHNLGIFGVTSFFSTEGGERCRLRIYDVDDKSNYVDFESPVVSAGMAKSNPIQALGATHSYMRRYMWLLALELTENDLVDFVDPALLKQPNKPVAPAVPAKSDSVRLNERESQVDVAEAPKKSELKEPTPTDLVFVEGLTKFGKTCENLAMLTDLWKGNQKEIDRLKIEQPKLYEELIEEFGKVKKEVSEKVKAAQQTKENKDGI